jgi:UDP-glucuronate 4-epimerase
VSGADEGRRAARTVLVTGRSGFIGYHLCRALLARGDRVVGIDAMTDYYDVVLKRARRERLRAQPGFRDLGAHIETPGLLAETFAAHRPDIVLGLAAQAGCATRLRHPRPMPNRT